MPAKQRFKNLAEELKLTDQQKQQLKPILQDEAQKLKNLRAKTGLTKRQKHAQLNQIRQDPLARAKPILTLCYRSGARPMAGPSRAGRAKRPGAGGERAGSQVKRVSMTYASHLPIPTPARFGPRTFA